jgi:hypothetical protein
MGEAVGDEGERVKAIVIDLMATCGRSGQDQVILGTALAWCLAGIVSDQATSTADLGRRLDDTFNLITAQCARLLEAKAREEALRRSWLAGRG